MVLPVGGIVSGLFSTQLHGWFGKHILTKRKFLFGKEIVLFLVLDVPTPKASLSTKVLVRL